MAKMEGRLKRDAAFMSRLASSAGRLDIAQAMHAASSASGGSGAFTPDGRAIAEMGDVTQAFKEDLEKID